MTTLELWLICILCYIIIGIAYYLKICNEIEKEIIEDSKKPEIERSLYYDNVPTLIDGVLMILLWPFYLLFIICRGIALSIDLMTDFLEKHGM